MPYNVGHAHNYVTTFMRIPLGRAGTELLFSSEALG